MRRSVRYSLALALVPLSLALAASATAQVDVEAVSFFRGVDRVAGGDEGDSARFQVLLRGTGITSAALVRPDGSEETLTETPAASGSFVASFDFADPADLATDFPESDALTPYQIDLNDGGRVLELVYEIPDLPSGWRITSPAHDSSSNSTTGTSFEFDACPPAACSNDDDHVFVTIRRDANVLARAVVEDANAGEYEPLDEDGLPLELPQNADLSFAAQLTAWRTHFEVFELVDPFLFFNVYVVGDEVDFGTAFSGLEDAPTGPFSVDVTDPAAGILVPGGTVMTRLAGVDLDYDMSVAPSGKVTGTGSADVDDNGVFETPFTVKGRLSGRNAQPAEKLIIKLKNKAVGSQAGATYKRVEVFDLVAETVERDELLKGKILGVKVNESASASDSIAGTPTDWTLDFTLATEDGRKLIVSAASFTVGGAAIPLSGSGQYNASKAESRLSLRSSGSDKGISVSIRGLEVDAMGNVTAGTASVRAYGQRVAVDLAP